MGLDPVTWSMILTGVTGAASVAQGQSAAKTSEAEGQMAAEMEDVAVMQRETDRKKELTKAISSMRASASGRGIDVGTGSPLSVINQAIEEERIDTQRDRFNARIAAGSARYAGQARAGQIRGQSYLSLLQTGATIASVSGKKDTKDGKGAIG